ncbi:hypothetical protein D3C87_1056880 [compost metagenome]
MSMPMPVGTPAARARPCTDGPLLGDITYGNSPIAVAQIMPPVSRSIFNSSDVSRLACVAW